MQAEPQKKADELTIRDLIATVKLWFKYLIAAWKLILFAGILGAALGLVYAFVKKPVYTASTTFVLEDDDKSGMGALSGIASLVGMDLSSMSSSNSLFKGDNIFEIYKSRLMIRKTLLDTSLFDGKPEKLINRYIASNQLRDDWGDKPALARIDFSIPEKQYTVLHDSVITLIWERIVEEELSVDKPDKKLSIIKVAYVSEDQLFARAFENKLVEKVNGYYIQTKIKKSRQNVAILQHQADSVRRVLDASLFGMADEADRNPNPNSAIERLLVPGQKKQVDVRAAGAIYEEIVKNLELGKVALRKETPLIQVIDEPVLPLKKKKPRKLYSLLIGGIVFGALVSFGVLFKRIYLEPDHHASITS